MQYYFLEFGVGVGRGVWRDFYLGIYVLLFSLRGTQIGFQNTIIFPSILSSQQPGAVGYAESERK